jgi:hypothetical protein
VEGAGCRDEVADALGHTRQLGGLVVICGAAHVEDAGDSLSGSEADAEEGRPDGGGRGGSEQYPADADDAEDDRRQEREAVVVVSSGPRRAEQSADGDTDEAERERHACRGGVRTRGHEDDGKPGGEGVEQQGR